MHKQQISLHGADLSRGRFGQLGSVEFICFGSENSFVGLGVYRCGCTYRFKNKMQFVPMCRVCVGVSCAGIFVLYQYHLDLHSKDSNKPNKPKYEHVLLLPGAGMTVRIWASSVLPLPGLHRFKLPRVKSFSKSMCIR
jgi:hypothetical protein